MNHWLCSNMDQLVGESQGQRSFLNREWNVLRIIRHDGGWEELALART